jgi:Transglycosylase SLT domain
VRLRSVRRTARPATVAGALTAAMVTVATCAAWTTPPQRGTAAATTVAAPAPGAPSAAGASVPRLIVPDVIAAVPGGVTAADIARLRKLSQVMAVLPIDGARITVNGKPLTVLGAPASALRQWLPPATAASAQVWRDFAAGDLITTAAAARGLRLARGRAYPVSAAVRTTITFGGTALLGVAGVDAIVNQAKARQLGLVRDVAVLVNAPAADMIKLAAQVKSVLGKSSQVIRLVPVVVSTRLPVDPNPPTGRPDSYLALFQESAAQYCPGLSWTVLAAIGQIESGDGANTGPSSAGALGPMQFLPSTWQVWGIDGFGDTGPPNIMNPYDAVPSAAGLLCASGATQGGQGLRAAIFAYNHATWYVDEVLTLAAEYAREFG